MWFIALRATGASFWTSGSNEGEFCNTLNVYSWCSFNRTLLQPEFFGETYWKNKTAANSEMDRCLIYKLNETALEKTGLEHASCAANNFYICEVFLHHYLRGKQLIINYHSQNWKPQNARKRVPRR